MLLVTLTAIGVGSATIIGAILGFLFKDFLQKYSKIFLAFAGGIMLAAALFSLLLKALEFEEQFRNEFVTGPNKGKNLHHF